MAGFEFAYNQIFDSGIIVGFNYTYTDTEGDIGERTIVLPSTSESTYNVTLGYEVGDFSTRLTYAYRDDYLDELGGSTDEDRWVQDQVKIDLSANYSVSQDTHIFVKIANLNDTDYVAYQRGPDQNRLLQYETYSWTGRIGVSINF